MCGGAGVPGSSMSHLLVVSARALVWDALTVSNLDGMNKPPVLSCTSEPKNVFHGVQRHPVDVLLALERAGVCIGHSLQHGALQQGGTVQRNAIQVFVLYVLFGLILRLLFDNRNPQKVKSPSGRLLIPTTPRLGLETAVQLHVIGIELLKMSRRFFSMLTLAFDALSRMSEIR